MSKNIKVGTCLITEKNHCIVHARVNKRINNKKNDGFNDVKYIVRYASGKEVEMTKHEIRRNFYFNQIKKQETLKDIYLKDSIFSMNELPNGKIIVLCAIAKNHKNHVLYDIKNYIDVNNLCDFSVISIGVSVCNKDDKFDYNFGKHLAFKRAVKDPLIIYKISSNGVNDFLIYDIPYNLIKEKFYSIYLSFLEKYNVIK